MSKEDYGYGLGERYTLSSRTDKGGVWVDKYTVVSHDGARRSMERTVPKRQRRTRG